jgi:hypothetical protein
MIWSVRGVNRERKILDKILYEVITIITVAGSIVVLAIGTIVDSVHC